MTTLLFLGTGAAGRTQLAVGLARQVAPDGVTIIAADLEPQPAPKHARDAARQLADIDITDITSIPCDQVNYSEIDLVITVTSEASHRCAVLPGAPVIIRWDIDDPHFGPDDQRLKRFLTIGRNIQKRVTELFTGGYYNTIVGLKNNNEIILDHFTEGVIVHDRNRIIRWFNRAAEKITGFDRRQAIGRDCWKIFNGGFCGDKCNFKEPRDNFDHAQYPIRITTSQGKEKRLEMDVVGMRDDADNFQGVLACFKDITEVTVLRRRLKQIQSFHGIVGKDESMHAVYNLITDLAASDCPVLVLGESGTGKELVANAIHGESPRSAQPFVTVNCGALPEGILESELFGHVRGAFTGAVRDKKGRFELAEGGTIFLDEVAELPPTMQVKLLRVLQESTFEPVGGEKTIHANVRVISATNQNLKHMVAQGKFREDLFYRLCVVPVELPPLRRRRNDIPLLIDHFIKRFNEENHGHIDTLSPDALAKLIDYAWPGNIRELQNAIQYTFVKCKTGIINIEHLPPEIASPIATSIVSNLTPSPSARRSKLSLPVVQNALKQAKGNKVKAAKILGIGRATLYRFLNDHNVPTKSPSKR